MLITATDCSYSAGNQRAAASSFRRPLPQQASSKRFAVCCFSRQLQSFPPTNSAGKRLATSQYDRGFFSGVNPPFHTCAPSVPSGENADLASRLKPKKKVIFMIWQAVFFWSCPEQHLIIHSEAAPKPRRWKSGPGGGDLFDVLLREAMTRM